MTKNLPMIVVLSSDGLYRGALLAFLKVTAQDLEIVGIESEEALVAFLSVRNPAVVIVGADIGGISTPVACPVIFPEKTEPARDILTKARRLARPGKKSFPDDFGITDAEKTVLWPLAEGVSDKLIVQKTGLPLSSVKRHVRGILKKLNVPNRTQVALFVRDRFER